MGKTHAKLEFLKIVVSALKSGLIYKLEKGKCWLLGGQNRLNENVRDYFTLCLSLRLEQTFDGFEI